MANANPAADLIRARLTGGERLPWAEVMRMALYEPGAGYYRRGVRRIGRGGDFFTSVSVGPVFGELLALFCISVWRSLGSPHDFAILEQGAHDGRLASDILQALQKHEPGLGRRVRYGIIEPDEELRAAQRATLGEWDSQADHFANLELPPGFPRHAVFLSNELLDAFPVHRVVFDADQAAWREMQVEDQDGTLGFVAGELSDEALRAELERLPEKMPDGCITEINLAMLEWLRQVEVMPFRGAVLVLDYGFTTDEWLASGQIGGSLRRYREHQSDDRVLEGLGECDLTSNVNFTRLTQEAASLRMPVLEFIEQGRFLTQMAAERLRSGAAPDAQWLRQFQTLTHPGMMGRTFHALVLGKGEAVTGLTTEERQRAARIRLGV